MKIIISICILCSIYCYSYAADTKVSDLSSVTPVVADTVYVIDATDTSSKKATIGAVFNAANDLDSNGDVANDSHDHTTTTLSGIVLADDLDTFSSTNLRERLTDETGTGVAVFGTSPIFTTGVTVPNDSISAAELNEGDNFTWTGVQNFDSATVIGVLTGETDTLANVVSRGSSAGGDMSASNITIAGTASSVRMATGVGFVDGNLEVSGEASAVNITATNKVTTVTFRATTDASSPILEATTRLDIGSGNNATLQLDGSDNLTLYDTIAGGIALNNLYLVTGDTPTGIHDFGGATSLEIPNAASPAVTISGQIAWDTNDDSIEVFAASGPRTMPSLIDKDFLIFAPDGVNDEIAIFKADSELYPHGITLASIQISLGADVAYVLPFEEWAGDPMLLQNGIASPTTSGSDAFNKIIRENMDDSAIDADDYIVLNVPSTDVDWVGGKLIFWVNDAK